MIQCSYQITKCLFAINRQEGESERKRYAIFIGWKENNKNYWLIKTGKKEHFVIRILIYSWMKTSQIKIIRCDSSNKSIENYLYCLLNTELNNKKTIIFFCSLQVVLYYMINSVGSSITGILEKISILLIASLFYLFLPSVSLLFILSYIFYQKQANTNKQSVWKKEKNHLMILLEHMSC